MVWTVRTVWTMICKLLNMVMFYMSIPLYILLKGMDGMDCLLNGGWYATDKFRCAFGLGL
jgi:hypothetical protein